MTNSLSDLHDISEDMYVYGLDQQLQGSVGVAREAFNVALLIYKKLGDIKRQLDCETLLGEIEYQCQNVILAQEHFLRATRLANTINDIDKVLYCQKQLADIAFGANNYAKAFYYYESLLSSYASHGDNPQVINVLRQLAHISRVIGKTHDAETFENEVSRLLNQRESK